MRQYCAVCFKVFFLEIFLIVLIFSRADILGVTSYPPGCGSISRLHAALSLLCPFEVTIKYRTVLPMADFSSFDMPSSGSSENVDTAELQRLIAVEQQKAQFQAQVCRSTRGRLHCRVSY